MKSAGLSKWNIVFFLFGVLIGSVSVVLINRGGDREVAEQSRKNCERNIDLGTAHTLMNAIPLHSKVLQLIEANQLQEAQTDLSIYTMTEMHSAYRINQNYKGALEEDLKPLLLEAYPPVRRLVDASAFARWPKSALSEMSNFMAEADAIVQTEHNANKVESGTH